MFSPTFYKANQSNKFWLIYQISFMQLEKRSMQKKFVALYFIPYFTSFCLKSVVQKLGNVHIVQYLYVHASF